MFNLMKKLKKIINARNMILLINLNLKARLAANLNLMVHEDLKDSHILQHQVYQMTDGFVQSALISLKMQLKLHAVTTYFVRSAYQTKLINALYVTQGSLSLCSQIFQYRD